MASLERRYDVGTALAFLDVNFEGVEHRPQLSLRWLRLGADEAVESLDEGHGLLVVHGALC